MAIVNNEVVKALNKDAITFVIPDTVTKVKEYAFSYCSKLTSITIPESVTSIDNYAFWGCYNLKGVKGKSGSGAQTWAIENGYEFIAE